jgi:hypothetical protein
LDLFYTISKEEESTEGTYSEEDEKTKGKYTTRHGSHLTKSTEGVSTEEKGIQRTIEISYAFAG